MGEATGGEVGEATGAEVVGGLVGAATGLLVPSQSFGWQKVGKAVTRSMQSRPSGTRLHHSSVVCTLIDLQPQDDDPPRRACECAEAMSMRLLVNFIG